eukprot:gene19659-39999_t
MGFRDAPQWSHGEGGAERTPLRTHHPDDDRDRYRAALRRQGRARNTAVRHEVAEGLRRLSADPDDEQARGRPLICVLMAVARPDGDGAGQHTKGEGRHVPRRRGRTGRRVLTSVPPAVADAHRAYRPGDRLGWLGPTGVSLRPGAARSAGAGAGCRIVYTLRGIVHGVDMARAADEPADEELLLPPCVDLTVDDVSEDDDGGEL